MPNQLEYIPSNGLEKQNTIQIKKGWSTIQYSEYKENIVIPFLKLLTDLRGALIKYLKDQRRQERHTNYLPRAIRTIKLCLGLTKSYIEIKKYSEDLFCTAEVPTIPYCLYVHKQHINREPIEYSLFMSTEVSETLPKVVKALLDFKAQITKFYKLLKELLPKEHQKLRLANLFMNDLKKKFEK